MGEIAVVLPERISILRDANDQGIPWDKEEYSVYYRNIIDPYSDEYDIQIECKYGKNLGNCWRIDTFDGIDREFELTLKIYSQLGILLSSKTCTIEIFEKAEGKKMDLLCIGDSMTMGETYISQAVDKACGINTVGLRSVRQRVRHEGRGGWTCEAYFKRYEDDGWGFSPFLFPKDCDGRDYFGSKTFWNKASDADWRTDYSYTGMMRQDIKDGMLCCENGRLYRYSNGKYIEYDETPEFEFDFKKYVERYLDDVPDIVSILFGANEFQLCGYDQAKTEIDRYICMLDNMVRSIKACRDDISVIICMPVCGGGQYAWGMRMGCQGSAKQYDFCIKRAGLEILRNFDNRRDENIFVCPMLAVCDPVTGFPIEMARANIYSEYMQTVHSDWVHPSDTGYKEMGDALAAVIAAVRESKKQ